MKKYNLLFALVLAYTFGFSQTKDKNAMRFANTITVGESRKYLSVLSADSLEGRETGKEGQRKAAEYIAADFKRIGLKSATDNSYLQRFPLTESTPEGATLEIGKHAYENLKDFYVFPIGENLTLEADTILFLGYGISDSIYDDYKNVDVKGKIVLILGGEPMSKDSVSLLSGSKEPSAWTTNYRKKTQFAKEKGVSALIVVSRRFDFAVQMLKQYFSAPSLHLVADKNEDNKKVPVCGISVKTADELFAGNKMSVEEVTEKIRTTKKPFSFAIKSPIKLDLKCKLDKVSSANVLGVVEGSTLKDQVVFVTAHYDHLGVIDGQVYNGADDDGSGTTAVLAIANAFEQAKEAGFGPKRTMVFMTVAGEEKGLLGSSYYTDHPIFPITNTVCDLNIDMIGRVDPAHTDSINYVYVIGSNMISTDLHKINKNANATYTNLQLDYKYDDPNDPNRFYYRSDHYNFAKKGVPIIFYFNGVHEDYHKATDEIAKINFDLLVKRAQLVFYTAWDVANRTERIKSDVHQGVSGSR